MPSFLTSDLRTPHGFFTRRGGVTEGHLGSLNCGSKFDTLENIRENQRRAMSAMLADYERLNILKQVHSNIVHVVEDRVLPRDLEGDAFVTKTRGMVLGILTADCVPVLFHDVEAGVIGAAHAGWKGALYGIIENTITAMEKLGSNRENIEVAIGACIRQPSYEVGAEYVERFAKEDKNSAAFFVPRPHPSPLPQGEGAKFLFDLAGYVTMRLRNAGIMQIDDLGVDTCTSPDDFFSCRRAFLRAEEGFGNGLSAILLATP